MISITSRTCSTYVMYLPLEKNRHEIEYDTERDANQNTCGKREVQRDVVALEEQIAGQFTDPSEYRPSGQFTEEREEATDNHQRDSQDNQKLTNASHFGHG